MPETMFLSMIENVGHETPQKKMKHIVKRHRQKEPFDERKLYASVYSSSMNAHLNEQEAEDIANEVTKRLLKEIQDRHEVSSHEIRKKVKAMLNGIDPDVALLYETFMDLS